MAPSHSSSGGPVQRKVTPSPSASPTSMHINPLGLGHYSVAPGDIDAAGLEAALW